MHDEEQAVAALVQAWRTGLPVSPPSHLIPHLTRETAYQIQRQVTATLSTELGPRVGWKLGLMSGEADPTCGPLHASMLFSDGEILGWESAVAPRIEVELALIVADSGFRMAAAFEVIDDRTTEPRTVADGIADLATMRAAVIGPPGHAVDLDDIHATLIENGATVGEGRLVEAIRNPFDGVRWLSDHLHLRRERLHPGDVILTGSLTGQHPVSRGSDYRALVTELHPLTVSFG